MLYQEIGRLCVAAPAEVAEGAYGSDTKRNPSNDKQAMKSPSVSTTNLCGSRRTFLKSASVLALAAPASLSAQAFRQPPPQSQWWHGRGRLQLLAEGVIPLNFVLPPLVQAQDPPQDPPVMAPRLRVTFPLPRTKDVLAVQIYLAPPPSDSVPLPLPVAPPLVPQSPTDPITLSYLEAKITAVELSSKPELNLALVGHVLVNDPAMFPGLTGAGFVLTAGYGILADGQPGFKMLGVHVPGNHTTIAPQGAGTLSIR